MKLNLDWSIIQMKPLLDYLKEMPIEEYQQLEPFFDIGNRKNREVILKSGAVEIESRFILEGIVGKFYLGALKRLYFPGDVCVEMESYSNQQPSRFELKVLKEARFTRLSFKNANLILDQFPKFQALSEELYKIARHKEEEWQLIVQGPYERARIELNRKYPGFESSLSQKQLASLLGVSPKTISRKNSREMQTAKFNRIIRYYKTHLSYPFESKIHPSVEELDNQTLVWGSMIHRFFTGSKDENSYKKSQLTWLSARLYPDARWENLSWLARLFALLFAMDDFTDQLPKGLKGELWEEIALSFKGVMQGDTHMFFSKSVLSYRNAFYELWQKLPVLIQQQESFFSFLQEEFLLYLESNTWEAKNRDKGIVPTLEAYRQQRPFFSGGQLAISLTPLGMIEAFSLSYPLLVRFEKLRRLAAKLIYLSNDLLSYEKERTQGDFHNLLRLMMHHQKLPYEKVREEIVAEHRVILQEFLDQAQQIEEQGNELERSLLHQIQYKVSGAVTWSLFDTTRYHELLKEKEQ
ncbi:terpene synthase family protein [Algoriphagus halophilus]|uniref:Terpene synthase n=1 Tax=Algoriphagus halophilus TaxID=226505 RepID=A0A1N6E6F1_9BACT|nr:hypothetical protein [Algoriphagus halophilus]SIN78571.1 cAMP-binding domain of CRP or a regulatory subunit of cAMP-dependent protein kinases [Algoriphagus halophilus]